MNDREYTIKDEGFKDFKTLDDLLNALKAEGLEDHTADGFGTFKFGQNTENRLTLDFGRGAMEFSPTGLDSFCKILGAPPKYIRTLPYDNVVKDLSASLLSSQLKKMNLIFNNKNVIQGVSGREKAIHTVDVIEEFRKALPSVDMRELAGFNHEYIINFTSHPVDMPQLDNDNFLSGLAITHDGNCGLSPEIGFFIYRLVCSNGAVSKELVAMSKISNRKGRDKVLEVFRERLTTSLDTVNMDLKEAIFKMTGSRIEGEDVKYINKYLKKKMDYNNHDNVQSNYNRKIKDGSTYYDLMNFITDSAKEYDAVEKHKLETLGGRMLSFYHPSRPSSEVLPGYTEFKRRTKHKELVEA